MSLFWPETGIGVNWRCESESAIKFNYVLSQLKSLKCAYFGLKTRIGVNWRRESESAIKINYVLSQLKSLKCAYFGLKTHIGVNWRCESESAIKFNYVLSQQKSLKCAYFGLNTHIGVIWHCESESAIKFNYVLSQLKPLESKIFEDRWFTTKAIWWECVFHMDESREKVQGLVETPREATRSLRSLVASLGGLHSSQTHVHTLHPCGKHSISLQGHRMGITHVHRNKKGCLHYYATWSSF